jgi:myo-inositol-1(or 4)-monophosphatase
MINRKFLLEGAVDAAFAAGKVIRKHYSRKLRIQEKSDNMGLVTNADVEAEEVAIRKLRKCHPGFALLTEETNSRGGMNGHEGMWILDPLDGTTNFVHRFPMFCVTIAAQIGQQIEVAVTYHPILDELYTAIRGKGAFMNGRRISVSQTKSVSDSLLSTGFAYHRRSLLPTEMTSFEKLSNKARAIRRPGSAALDLAYTARGVFDGFWERHLAPWDVAAGSLLVTEAGGRVTDFSGKNFNPHDVEILASNGKLHRQLIGNL